MESVLRWVNEIRQQHELPTLAMLPKGRPFSCRECPIARGLSGTKASGTEVRCSWGVDAGDLYVGTDQRMEIVAPEFVGHFVTDFDLGRIPDLIA